MGCGASKDKAGQADAPTMKQSKSNLNAELVDPKPLSEQNKDDAVKGSKGNLI